MTARISRSALALVLFLLGGCNMLAGRPHPVTLHVLEPPAGAVHASPAATTKISSAVLLVRDTESPGVFQSLNLVYSRTPGTLSYYQYARWSEMPARRFNTLMRQRLDASGLYGAVAEMGSGVLADYQLNTRLLDFHHDAAQSPGVARVFLEAELVHRRDARLIARRQFKAEAPVPAYDATGAANGLGLASARILDELMVWLSQVQPVDAR